MYAFMQEMLLGSFSVRFFAVNMIVMHDSIDFVKYPVERHTPPDVAWI